MSPVNKYTSAVEPKGKGITFEDMPRIKKYIKSLKKDLYYAINEFVEVGTAYFVESGDLYPEYIVCHPGDFEVISNRLGVSHRLIPLHEYTPSDDEVANVLEKCAQKVRNRLLSEPFVWKKNNG